MVVSAQTKSGTNAVHGSAFEFLRNDHLQGRDPFTQSQPIYGGNGRVIPVTIWNQMGGSIGGPIRKDKLFYFGDYQATRRRTGGSKTVWVPSAANRAGDLSTWAEYLRYRQRFHSRDAAAVHWERDPNKPPFSAGPESHEADSATE